MENREMLQRVLESAVMAKPEDLKRMDELCAEIEADTNVAEVCKVAADLVRQIPFLKDHDIDLLRCSARHLNTQVQ